MTYPNTTPVFENSNNNSPQSRSSTLREFRRAIVQSAYTTKETAATVLESDLGSGKG